MWKLSSRPKLLALAAITSAVALTPASASAFKVINLTVASAWNGVAPCIAPARLTARVIDERLSQVARSPRSDAVVARVAFHDQPSSLVTGFRLIAGRRLEKDAPLAKAVAAECSDVVCASRVVFGPGVGERLLLLAAEYRYDATPLVEGAAKPWSAEDLDLLIAGFSDWPSGTFPRERGKLRIVTDHPSEPLPGGLTAHRLGVAAAAGEGRQGITFFPAWHKVKVTERRVIILHELAHEFARRQAGDWRSRWQEAAAKDAAQASERGASFASAYAQANVDEDFAESVAAYRYSAPMILRRAPSRYAFLKRHVFGGVEYGAAAACRGPEHHPLLALAKLG